MGWSFRRSINLGPIRLNLGKSGVGTSIGAGPFRIGRSANGRTYRSFRIPGTGISYRDSGSGGGRASGADGGNPGTAGGGDPAARGCGCLGVVAIAATGVVIAAFAATRAFAG
jgi:hypothetical protein